MRILKVEPGQAPYEKEMEDTLAAIQQEVQGLFQPVYMEDGVLLCTAREAAEELAVATRSEVVQVIGSKFVLYRMQHDKSKRKIELVKAKRSV